MKAICDECRERSVSESNGGGGGNRTRVRRGSNGSFYTISRLVFYLASRSLSGKQPVGQPLSFARRSGALPPGYPDLASPCRVASGRATLKTSRLKPRVRTGWCQLLYSHRIYEVVALVVLLPPHPTRRILFAPFIDVS